MRYKITLKKAAALCLSVLISMCIFSSSGNNGIIQSHADNKKSSTQALNPQYSKKLSQLEAEQKRLENEIAKAEEEIKKADSNAESLKIKSAAVEKQIKNYKEQAIQIEMEIAEVDSKLRDSQNQLDTQKTNIESSTEEFMKRIRTMYVTGAADTYGDILLNSQDFYDILMRTELVKRVAKHDNKQLNSLLEQKRKMEQTDAVIQESLKKLKETSNNYVQKQKELADKQSQLEQLQAQAQQNADTLNKQKAELSKKSEEISRKFGIVSKKAQQTTSLTTKETTQPTTQLTEPSTTTQPQTYSSKVSTQHTETSDAPQTEKKQSEKTENSTQKQTTEAPSITTTKPQTSLPKQDENTSSSSKIDKVLAYAKSNVGGSYVWGGSSFRATDCSGLVMLSYAQVGISLPHLASSQASYGTEVSYANMQPGDLIFFGSGGYSSIYHVAIYIGNGLMVHAENTSVGIVISSVAGFSSSNNIVVIKRLIQ